MLSSVKARAVLSWYLPLAVAVLGAGLAQDGVAQAQTGDELKVAVLEAEPFVVREGDVPGGFLFDVWDHVAVDLGWDYEVVWVESLTDVGDLIRVRGVDVAIAPLASSREREENFDFTSGIVASGPVFGVHDRTETPVSVLSALFSADILKLLGWSAVLLLVLGHMMWLVERKNPDTDFATDYVRGAWDGVWWAIVTVTTVGYGDTSPRTGPGRLVAILAMLGSLFLVGAFVSEVTTALQAQRAAAVVADTRDLEGEPVGVVEESSYQAYLEDRGVTTVGYASQPDVFAAAAAGDVDVVVADQYELDALGGDFGVRSTGELLYDEFIAFAVREDSPLRSEINGALSDLHRRGVIREIVARWTQ
jgi:polar amino acid transport system substrate-binding protein